MRAQLYWFCFFGVFFIASYSLNAQDDLLDLLGEEEPQQEFASAGFKTTRVINNHSFEMNAHGVMDLKISHRFGSIFDENFTPVLSSAFGLDNALMRIGLDYGVNDWLNVGFGRSGGAVKYLDGFAKAKILKQQTGKKNIPLALLWVSDMAVDINPRNPPNGEAFKLEYRLLYTHQLIVGRKFSEGFSLQLMPTVVHRNFVNTRSESNTVFSMGAAGRLKLTKRIAINAEYHYVLPDQLAQDFVNSLSIGFDIETGGHVFQLHFSNSMTMIEPAFITTTRSSWLDGGIHFGFNVSRVFTVYRPK